MLDAAHLTDRIRPMRRSGGLFLGFESQILRCWVERGIRQVEILDPEQIMKACLLVGGQVQATETPFPDWLDQISQTFLRDMPVQREALLQKCPLSLPEDPAAIRRFDQALRLLQEPEEGRDLDLRLKLDDLRLFKPTDPRLGLGVRLTTDGVLLGKGLRLARLNLQPDGTVRLLPVGGRERVLALLSLACNKALKPIVLKQFSYAERALNDGDLSRAGIALAHIGVWPPLRGDDPQDLRLYRLDQIAAAEQAGAPWAKIAKTLRQSGLLKYSPDQPRVPAGEPDGGQWCDAGGGEINGLTSKEEISITPLKTIDFALLSEIADKSVQEQNPEPDVSQEISKEAATWLNTPYAPKTDLKRRGDGATKGPDGGADCSGSVWRIYQNTGHGYPYTRSDDFPDAAKRGAIPFRQLGPGESPREGDVVVYPGHMSIYDGRNGVYSAHRSGKPFGRFGDTYFGNTPRYYRYTGR